MKIPDPKKREAWRKQERRLERESGARQVPGSGNGYRKGDNMGQSYLVQAKTTKNAQFSLTLNDLIKTAREAAVEDRLPVMQLQLKNEVRVAVLPWEDFEELVLAAKRTL